MTEWRDIPGYEGRYQISDDGRIMTFPDATAVAQTRFNGFGWRIRVILEPWQPEDIARRPLDIGGQDVDFRVEAVG